MVALEMCKRFNKLLLASTTAQAMVTDYQVVYREYYMLQMLDADIKIKSKGKKNYLKCHHL